MKDYVISEPKLEVLNFGMDDGVVVGEIKLTSDDGEAFYLSLNDIESIPTFFKTEESMIAKQVEPEIDSEFWGEMMKHSLEDYMSYDDLFNDKDNEMYDAYHVLAYMVRCGYDNLDGYKEMIDGKRVSEIDVPLSDVEEEWMYENGELDDEEEE